MKIQSIYSHTISGVFYFDLPIGILLAFVFHNKVRNSLIENLPILKSRMSVFKHFDWSQHFKNHWFVIIISVLIGAFSHILWDSFTHHKGYFVEKTPFLKSSINLLGKEILVLKILQHSSTLIGGLIIIIALFSLPKDKNIDRKINLRYWFTVIFISVLIISIRLLIEFDFRNYGNIIVTVISAFLISLILTPIISKKTYFII